MLLQETYFIAMATFAACGGSSYAYSIHNVNATKCRRPFGPTISSGLASLGILHLGVRQNVAGACGALWVVGNPPCPPKCGTRTFIFCKPALFLTNTTG